MADGISPNPLNDISKAYLEVVAKINKDEEEKIIQKWDDSSVNKVDPDLVLKVESKRTPVTVVNKESYSNWRTDLREITSDAEAQAIDDEPEIKEKKVNNKKLIKINPEFKEAIEEIGGELLEVKEVEDDAKKKQEAEKEKTLKMRILRYKMMATRQGADAGIVAHYEPAIEGAVEYFYEQGIN